MLVSHSKNLNECVFENSRETRDGRRNKHQRTASVSVIVKHVIDRSKVRCVSNHYSQLSIFEAKGEKRNKKILTLETCVLEMRMENGMRIVCVVVIVILYT